MPLYLGKKWTFAQFVEDLALVITDQKPDEADLILEKINKTIDDEVDGIAARYLVFVVQQQLLAAGNTAGEPRQGSLL